MVFSGDTVAFGKYRLYGAGTAGFVGLIGTNDSYAGPQIPTNNATTWYGALDDGYFFLGMDDFSGFKMTGFDASFIGAGQPSYPAVSALMYIAGYKADGSVVEKFVELPGPTGGSFKFAHYDMGLFGTYHFTDVLFASYACDATGNCNRNTNQANFAIDNIATDVPEPGTFALLGLGLLGLGAASRRRA